TNTARASSTTADPSGGNNNAAATATVGSRVADLGITKTAVTVDDPVAGATVAAGGQITYTITATNAGPSDAPSPVVSDTIPPGTTHAAAHTDRSIATRPVTATIAPGAFLSYTITATNGGPSAVTTTVVSDSVPAGTTYRSVTPPAGWTCDQLAGDISCTIGSLAPGASAAFVLEVQVNSSTTDSVTNTAAIATDSGTD